MLMFRFRLKMHVFLNSHPFLHLSTQRFEMSKIIHLSHGDRPNFTVSDPPTGVLEWKCSGGVIIKNLSDRICWHYVSDEYFDRYVDSAYQMVDYVGYHIFYIIGRPLQNFDRE